MNHKQMTAEISNAGKEKPRNMLCFCRDTRWTEGGGPFEIQIALATFGILALELAVIRWTSSQIRIFAYFNNLVLIGAFLGMGFGVALGRRYGGLLHWTMPALLLLSIPLAFSEQLGLVHMAFPDKGVFLWGGEQLQGNAFQYLRNLFLFIFLFELIVLVFLLAGAAVGCLFSKLPPLRAYSFDLAGSLVGIIGFTVATLFNASPPVWLLIGGLPFVWLSRKPLALVCLAATVLLGWYSISGAVYSPYNRIDIQGGDRSYVLEVNRDFHQYMHDLSDRALTDTTRPTEKLKEGLFLRDIYDLPFQMNPHRDQALIVGSGTGNDVQAALRNGYRKVFSVDIDGEIIDLGKRLHPEKPYDDKRVVPVVNDARAFFEQYQGKPFDNICYGLLDSHAMFSSMSSLRLDNYVYTEEGIRAAWKHLSPEGHLSISFSIFAGKWISDRLFWTITKATGKKPVAVYHGMHYGATYVVAPDMSNLVLTRLKGYPRLTPERNIKAVRTTTDDWPFLYIRPGHIPWGYVIVLGTILIFAAATTPLAFGRKALSSDFDPVLFFMGAAFLLIETRGVTSLSLVFGSTWIVNSAIFAGILITVLVANMAVARFRFQNSLPWFFGLFLALILLWRFDAALLNQFSMLSRGLIGGLVNALPIGFAGVIVSISLARSANPTASLGSNLLGSVVGGCLEYFSMYIGLQTLVLLAMVLYLAALYHLIKKRRLRTLWPSVKQMS
jgi:hypothetical protein